jgi:hypothetical protein
VQVEPRWQAHLARPLLGALPKAVEPRGAEPLESLRVGCPLQEAESVRVQALLSPGLAPPGLQASLQQARLPHPRLDLAVSERWPLSPELSARWLVSLQAQLAEMVRQLVWRADATLRSRFGALAQQADAFSPPWPLLPSLPFPLLQRLPPELPPRPAQISSCAPFPRRLREWSSSASSFP